MRFRCTPRQDGNLVVDALYSFPGGFFQNVGLLGIGRKINPAAH